MITEPEHKTKILPLRWFANLCNHIGTPHIVKMFDMQENHGISNGFIWNYHSFIWNWTWKVYQKWGTTYKIMGWDADE